MTSLYDILGVPEDADDITIKKAYRHLAIKYHPDKHPDPKDSEKFKEISHAYQILSDPQKRQQYDTFGSLDGNGGPSFDDFQFFFSGFPWQSTGNDIYTQTKVTLEEVMAGVSKTVEITRNMTCSTCKGSGEGSKREGVKCKRCRNGKVTFKAKSGRVKHKTCDNCSGTGMFYRNSPKCASCRGSGYESNEESLTVTIPKGTLLGEKIMISDKGHEIDGTVGNAFVQVIFEDHPRFVVVEYDLYTTVQISLKEALCGVQVKLKGVDGQVLMVTTSNVSTVSSDSIRRVEGHGLNKKNGDRGDLFIKFLVEFPAHISEESLELLRKVLPDLETSREEPEGDATVQMVAQTAPDAVYPHEEHEDGMDEDYDEENELWSEYEDYYDDFDEDTDDPRAEACAQQ